MNGRDDDDEPRTRTRRHRGSIGGGKKTAFSRLVSPTVGFNRKCNGAASLEKLLWPLSDLHPHPSHTSPTPTQQQQQQQQYNNSNTLCIHTFLRVRRLGCLWRAWAPGRGPKENSGAQARHFHPLQEHRNAPPPPNTHTHTQRHTLMHLRFCAFDCDDSGSSS